MICLCAKFDVPGSLVKDRKFSVRHHVQKDWGPMLFPTHRVPGAVSPGVKRRE